MLDVTVQERFWAKVAKSDGCWEWTGSRARRGYGKVRISGVLYSSHRLSFEWAVGPIPAGLNVLHHCDNPPCVNPDHLFLGSHAENTADMTAKGRHFSPFKGQVQVGAANRQAKIGEEDVRAIRALDAQGVPRKIIAERYGIHRSNISHIVSRKSWAHVV